MANVTNALAVTKKLEQNGIQLAQPVYQKMAAAGFDTEDKQATLIAVALCAGIDYKQLDLEENIRAAITGWKYTTDYGAMPGVHYYAVPFDKKEKRGDEWVVVGKTYAIVRSTAWLHASVNARGDMSRVRYQLETRPVMGERLKELLEYFCEGEFVEHKLNRGYEARFVPVEKGVQTIGPDANWSFGFYLHEGYWLTSKAGKRYKGNGDGGRSQSNPNNTPAMKAERRAIRNAAKKVSPELLPVDKRSTEDRIRGVLGLAWEKAIDMKPALPEEASDFNPDTDGDDVLEGEFTVADAEPEVKPELRPEPAPKVKAETTVPSAAEVLAEPRDEDDGEEELEGLERQDVLTLAACEPKTQELVGMLRNEQLLKGDNVKSAGQAVLREWVIQAMGEDDAEVEAGIRQSDLVMLTLFGTEPGILVHAAQATAFKKLVAREVDGTDDKGRAKKVWEFVADSDGAQAVRDIALHAQEVFSDDGTF